MQQGGEPHLWVPLGCLTYTVEPACPAIPTLRPARVRLFPVLLGQRPSLHDLLRPSQAFVRPLRWYYAAVRLPIVVHMGLIAYRFPPPIRCLSASDDNRVSRFSRVKFPCMRGVFDSAVPATRSRLFTRATVLPSGSPDTVGASDFGYFGAHNFGIPSLHVPLSNASSAASRPPSHGSGSRWFAIPFLYDSFIHYFTPVYPDAIQAEPPAPP